MDEALLELTVLLAVLIGLAGVALGLVGILARGRRGWIWHGVVTGFAVLLAACGFGAVSVGLPLPVWAPILVLACGCLAVQSLQVAFVGRLAVGLLMLLGRPWVHSGVLLAVCPLVALWCGVRLTPQPFESALLEATVHPEQMTEVTTAQAVTDRGQHLPLYAASEEDVASVGAALDDARVIRDRIATLIRTAPPDLTHNCHGWVFAGGQHWVKGRDVDTILSENGYTPVSEPRVGDVIVYRDAVGVVLHTGLVRVAEPGLILIESKWGALGRYVHQPEDQCYGTRFTFYRSSRQGHLLVGLNPPSPSSAPLVRPRRAG